MLFSTVLANSILLTIRIYRILMTAPPYDPDDLARAVLLRVVPQGYRLIGEADERFAGRRDPFFRLALRHLSARPSLVGFTGPGEDPRAAARSLAEWAAANLRPSAVQRTVNPGVLVIAVGAEATAGAVPRAAVPAAVWTVDGEGVHASGRPSGSPAPGILKDADRRLRRGEPAPTIGHIDVAERTMMSGRGRQRAFALGGGSVIVLVIVGFLFLRFVSSAIFSTPSNRAPGGQAAGTVCAVECILVDPAATGSGSTSLQLAVGEQARLRVTGARACPAPVDPSVVRRDRCEVLGGGVSSADGLYTALTPGTTEMVPTPAAPRPRSGWWSTDAGS